MSKNFNTLNNNINLEPIWGNFMVLETAVRINSMQDAIHDIHRILLSSRDKVAHRINNELLSVYWNVGKKIFEFQQKFKDQVVDEPKSLKEISKSLTSDFGTGFSVSNLRLMKLFYLTYPQQQTLSVSLSWAHYCVLLTISDPYKRSFYEKESVYANWSVRELKRQIESSLFERLMLSQGEANKEKLLSLALKDNEISQPKDILQDPHVFEFLGIPEDKTLVESDLEKALVQQIKKFLLELGRGFMFVGTQQPVTINNTHYYVDMVFYNKILRAYVLIEIKTTKFTPEAAGQINMFLNYYASEVNDYDDNPPIGIILCTNKDSVSAEYALGGLANKIFASRYVLYIPNKEQLISQAEAVLQKWHGKSDDKDDKDSPN
ncbi:PDDEXK nuclease domain-containing protein [Succinatimonas hippei]|uniref:DUF1016 domain-containing protein n=1 Tax=Succinatimonas hippei (strain DSM 22608 / JCM 16073 / KCTC 15190 / YIT 12066) TaxID=762983 RepID=E8LHZ8_SUCHY|nr:PDDEXK nuclease domain-containing protein [Succinatimonas hippei]EFY07819.1 hypothetical protein HMPREF9444_00312 [Succinatimonas hippei YIT 12066]